MFIAQSFESIDQEIIGQMRVFSFGYGVTIGPELGRVRRIINNDDAENHIDHS